MPTIVSHGLGWTPEETLAGVVTGVLVVVAYYLFLRLYVARDRPRRRSGS